MVLDQPTPLSWEKITRANADLSDRLFREGVRIDYDDDGDTLFITVGDGGPSVSKQAVDDIYLRVDPETYRIVGCTILAFASDLLGKNKVLRKLFPNALEALRAAGGTLEWKGRDAEKTKPLFDVALSLRPAA